MDDSEIIYKLKQVLYEADFQQNTARNSKSMATLISENIKQIQDNTKKYTSVKTGFTQLDTNFGGFELGEIVVIGGRPAMGKTQLLVNLSLHISQKMHLLYFSFDLSEFSLSSRFLSCVSGIAVEKIMQNKLSDDEKQKVASFESNFKNHQLFFNDSCYHSISAFKALCENQIKENHIKVIVIDYLQLMGTNKYRHNREYEISYISRELKNIAKTFNVCIIISSQLSRALETRSGSKRPQLSDLRDSGAIEQDADKVLFVYRAEYYKIDEDEEGESTDRRMELILAKNKNGVLGTVHLLRDENFTSFQAFDPNKNEFTFSKERLKELYDQNPNLINLVNDFNLDADNTPF
ncbi:hypothetical protein B0A58_06365 [Flavobacterium branchiophilum NBRC 15030 = ATCC 35035]|nr:hypothetical protein B0A58_06365 [Flavobacterium branchiophilum NBRC 15030 = ATCC 35035]